MPVVDASLFVRVAKFPYYRDISYWHRKPTLFDRVMRLLYLVDKYLDGNPITSVRLFV